MESSRQCLHTSAQLLTILRARQLVSTGVSAVPPGPFPLQGPSLLSYADCTGATCPAQYSQSVNEHLTISCPLLPGNRSPRKPLALSGIQASDTLAEPITMPSFPCAGLHQERELKVSSWFESPPAAGTTGYARRRVRGRTAPAERTLPHGQQHTQNAAGAPSSGELSRYCRAVKANG